MKRKFRKYEYIAVDDYGQEIFVTEIQVRDFLFWHTVTVIEDEDLDYVESRADEIIDILENPER